MPNGIGIRGITYDTDDLQLDDLTIHLQITLGLDEVPQVRGTDTIVPSLAGRIPRDRVADIRSIALEGFVQGDGATEDLRRASYRTSVAALQSLFDPTRDPADLVVTLEDDTTATILARPLALTWAREAIPCFRNLVVSLESVDPDWGYEGS